jgi:hypothetical protein
MARKPHLVDPAVEQIVDMINAPPHYTGEIDCIEAIEAALGPRGFADFLRGQVIKYQWRLGKKGSALENAEKSQWYDKALVEHLKDNPGLYAE